ncbi:MAG: hypothetical protein L6Q97_21135 [Thermoanaerobaculia bacterium]|nr:hypothetical protein [Thermoanaerobaculia bacterium]
MFVNPDSADFRLQACSPLVDAGSNDWLQSADSTDLGGLPRIRGGTVDIGAYEMQGPALAAPAVASPSCPGGASGSLAVDLQGACPPLHVAWSSASAAGQGLQGLPAGDYGFTVTDARGQSIAFSASVPTGDSMTLLSAVTPVLCGQTAGGNASATLKDGLPPFSWNWYPGPAADSLRTNLPAGDYLVTVTDARGCAAAALLRVDKSGSLDIDIQVGPISCHGAADGYFSIVPLNGKAPFSWLWDTGADSSAIGPIGPGTYNGAVTDALGCTLGWVLPLDEPGKIAANALVTPASDSLTANGAVELMPTGGTPPFTAHWNTGAAGLSIDSLAAGTYSITLTDANDCTLTENIAVGVTNATGEPTPAKQTISLLPNPATDLTWLTFDQPLPKSRRLRLWNTAALLLLDMQLPAGTQRLPLRLDGLPKGLYFVEVGGVGRTLAVE